MYFDIWKSCDFNWLIRFTQDTDSNVASTPNLTCSFRNSKIKVIFLSYLFWRFLPWQISDLYYVFTVKVLQSNNTTLWCDSSSMAKDHHWFGPQVWQLWAEWLIGEQFFVDLFLSVWPIETNTTFFYFPIFDINNNL